MIFIKKATCKNFLSYGNSSTTFELGSHKTTLIRGKNGHGKSVLMDLLLFGFYGKPYRNINKTQIMNSINKAGLLVEIDFEMYGVQYKIVRGIKPNVFDIFKNGELVEQSAATRDYQDLLESQILKVNEKTFKQIAVLGSASYVPFMQLPAAQRRELIENILDIEVFGRMNKVLKDRIAGNKIELKEVLHQIELAKVQAGAQQKLIATMQTGTANQIESLQAELNELKVQINLVKAERDKIQLKLDDIPTHVEDHTQAISDLRKELTTLETLISVRTKSIDKIKEINTCPNCFQVMDEAHRSDTLMSLHNELMLQMEQKSKYLRDMEDLKASQFVYVTAMNQRTEYQTQLDEKNKIIKEQQDHKKTLQVKITKLQEPTADIEAEVQKLKAIGAGALVHLSRKKELSEEAQLQDIAIQLLKDTGIKTAVVKEYLPILNKLINKYLAMFDFFVEFTLDESFTEVIKSRGRDTFSYGSFSEGEKRRIDLSVLLAFRQLAAMKNSAKTNVLILDEILDSNLDQVARVQAFDLITGLDGANVVVISHNELPDEDFDRVLLCEKKGDFSFVKEL